MTNTTEKRVEKLWKKFKSVLGNSSIDNKRNSMYDLEDFLIDSIAQAIAEERERVKGVIKAGVEKYKLSKQVGNMAGDYIFTYDLETFVLSSLQDNK